MQQKLRINNLLAASKKTDVNLRQQRLANVLADVTWLIVAADDDDIAGAAQAHEMLRKQGVEVRFLFPPRASR